MNLTRARVAITGLSLILASLVLNGCSSRIESFPTLVNQGILPVSPSNSYLGTNLFLGSEAGKSSILFQFLKSRGSPGAIEIVEENFKPSKLLLFYPRQVQVYMAELSSSSRSYDWIVRGPYSIERSDFKRLSGIDRANYESSPLIVNGIAERFVRETPTPLSTPLPTTIPTPAATAALKKKAKVVKPAQPKPASAPIQKPEAVPSPAATVRTSSIIPSGPGLNSDQQALRIAKGLTELSSSGDPIHKVEKTEETLENIAKWYTGDPAQAKAIAEYNSLPAGSELPKGAKIKIPKSIAKTDQLMH